MRRILVAIVLTLFAAAPAPAATVRYLSDGDLVAMSARVVRGRVLDATTERTPDGLVRTRTRVAVLEDLAGSGEAVVTVSELGGRLPDGRTLWIPGAPQFGRGDEVVLCLERAATGYRTVALAFSAFRVATSPSGARVLSRLEGEINVVGGPAAVPPSRTLEAFRTTAAAVTGQASRPVLGEAEAAAMVAAARVEAPFTLLGGGFRWREADDGLPITWYRNTLTPSPLQNGDTDTEIRVALQAWTAPPESSIVLAFGGTRFDDVTAHLPATAYCSDVNLGSGLITFGDPRDELAGGVLAIGGGCGSGTTHTVGGTTFQSFTHGLVVMSRNLAGYTSPPNITRILQHEIGHAIGLGHTDQGVGNIMWPSCCPPGIPVPPTLGPDDRAGLEFIYPLEAVTCTYTLTPSAPSLPAIGGEQTLTVAPSRASCSWTASAVAPWLIVLEGASGSGAGVVRFVARPHLRSTATRTGTLLVAGQNLTVTQAADTDADADQLSDAWENFFGLDPVSATGVNGPDGDPDGDGLTNAAEQAAGTHPRGTFRRYLAEGAANAFFDTELALFNPRTDTAAVWLRFQPDAGDEVGWPVTVPPRTRATILSPLLEALTTASFSTLLESDRPIVLDRTMSWDASGYGAHAEAAVTAPATTWYLAEGSTSGEFSLFYLLQNPGDADTTATIRFLRPSPQAPVERSYTVAARTRLTIAVDQIAELASTDVSGVVTASTPIIVERAMYLNRPGQPFAAGHESAGVTAPATEWFLAEGATGSFFDLFALIANPGSQEAQVLVEYLLPNGTRLGKSYLVAPQSRFTIYVDAEQIPAGSGQRPLATTSVAMRFLSLNDVPIVVERAMWWPQPEWYEAHNAPATTVTGTEWAMAAGSVGGPSNTEMYVLIANPDIRSATVMVLLAFEDGSSQLSEPITVAPGSRTTVSIRDRFPMAAGRRFATLVSVPGAHDAVPIVVERAIYDSVNGMTWSAGTAAVATRLTP